MVERPSRAQSRVATKSSDGSESFTAYTLPAYNSSVSVLLRGRRRRLVFLAFFSILAGIVFPFPPALGNLSEGILFIAKLSWLIPLPFLALYYVGLNAFSSADLQIEPERLLHEKEKAARNRIIYTTVTNGRNMESVEDTINSVFYWTRRVQQDYGLSLPCEVWIVTEEDARDLHTDSFEKFEKQGARICVVPRNYKSQKGAKYKARALQHAVELRRSVGCNTVNDWVYHQDDETMVGEDTVLGILDFVAGTNGGSVFGAGFILYPQYWQNKPSFVEEFARSSLHDVLYLYSLRSGLPNPAGFHGSHFLCRADVEEKIGWDFENALVEDRLFALRVLEARKSMGILKGFAYEQAPFTIRELLKQRRRWLSGLSLLLRRNDVSIREKLPIAAGLTLWVSAAISGIALIASLLYPAGGLFFGSGLLAGFVGYTLFDVYRTGYALNEYYVIATPRSVMERLRLAVNCCCGLVVDFIAPWYTLLTRTRSYETVRKDIAVHS